MESVSVSISSWFTVDDQYEIRVRIIQIEIGIAVEIETTCRLDM